jgi:hypothetical protein
MVERKSVTQSSFVEIGLIRGFKLHDANKSQSQTNVSRELVTRTEEWCVEATSPEEAKALLETGEGYRYALGDICCLELGEVASS